MWPSALGLISCKISLVNLYSECNVRVLLPIKENDKGREAPTHLLTHPKCSKSWSLVASFCIWQEVISLKLLTRLWFWGSTIGNPTIVAFVPDISNTSSFSGVLSFSDTVNTLSLNWRGVEKGINVMKWANGNNVSQRFLVNCSVRWKL